MTTANEDRRVVGSLQRPAPVLMVVFKCKCGEQFEVDAYKGPPAHVHVDAEDTDNPRREIPMTAVRLVEGVDYGADDPRGMPRTRLR